METICKKAIEEEQCESMLLSVGDAFICYRRKWKLRIIIALFNGTKRFNQINRTVKGISARVLSNELKDLEMNGFIKRIVHADETPVIVEYRLTTYSYSLENVVMALANWGAAHRDKIRDDRRLKQ